MADRVVLHGAGIKALLQSEQTQAQLLRLARKAQARAAAQAPKDVELRVDARQGKSRTHVRLTATGKAKLTETPWLASSLDAARE